MNMHPMNSSNIASIGYDENSMTLEIEFSNGATYQFYDVPPTIYKELMSAPSHGKYFNEAIKGYFRYARI